MSYQFIQMISGLVLLCFGTFAYSRYGDAVFLLLLVMGSISATTSGVVIGVRQALKDERKQREQEARPVLNI
jgi:hypothetical protein